MDLEANMEKSLEATQRNLNTIRTGRANPNLLDKVMVEYYGCDTPLRSLAGITAPDSQTLQIQPFDISAIRAIEKAILSSGLGLTPNEDGKLIRIGIPPLTEERRKELVKLAAGYVEEGKVPSVTCAGRGLTASRSRKKLATCPKTNPTTRKTTFKS